MAALVLAGCTSQGAAGEGTIDCAAGAAPLERRCTVETLADAAGETMIVGGTGTGYYRLRRVDDGRGVVALDGALRAEVQLIADTRAEVRIGDARFLLPAQARR